MPAQATLLYQTNFMVTKPAKIFLLALADLIRDSQGEVSRYALQAAFGFTPETQVPGGTTLEKILTEAYRAMCGDRKMPAEAIATALRRATEEVEASPK